MGSSSSTVLCADTHCHLDDPAFDKDLDDILRRAREEGIHPIVAPSETISSAERVIEIAGQFPSVLPCVGIHPHKAETFTENQRPAFERLASLPAVVGIGEIGLDYFYEFSPPDKQRETLAFFLDLAVKRNLPSCLHVRDKNGQAGAVTDMVSLLRPHAGTIRGVVHCFTGTYDEAVQFLDLGLHLSFTGILTFKKAASVRDVFARLPDDRILLETDAPYLAPDPIRGKRNEPAFLKHVFSVAAATRRFAAAAWSDRLRQTQQTLFGPRCG